MLLSASSARTVAVPRAAVVSPVGAPKHSRGSGSPTSEITVPVSRAKGGISSGTSRGRRLRPASGGGVRLHHAHEAAANDTTNAPGMPLRARGRGAATDDDRVGNHQPPPRGGIGGPCRLHRSNGRPRPAATTAARHLAAGAAPPRPNAWSSVGNPRASGLAPDSTVKVHSCRAGTETRGRGGMPGREGRITLGHHAASSTSTSISAAAFVASARAPKVASSMPGSMQGAGYTGHHRVLRENRASVVARGSSPTIVCSCVAQPCRTDPVRAHVPGPLIPRKGVHPPVRGKRVATGRMATSLATLPPRAAGGKWPMRMPVGPRSMLIIAPTTPSNFVAPPSH